MADVLRSCAKTGCRWPAAASLSYRYATRQVWLLDLASSPDPSLYDLCPHHADHLVVPKGWERVDDRSAEEIMVEPSAFDRAEQAARRRMTSVEPVPRQAVAARPPQLVGAAAGAGRNRYAALAEQLPKLAAEQAAHSEPTAAQSAEPKSARSLRIPRRRRRSRPLRIPPLRIPPLRIRGPCPARWPTADARGPRPELDDPPRRRPPTSSRRALPTT